MAADSLLNLLHHQKPIDPYLEVPECIRQYYSREEWLTLSDYEKANLIQTETEPEC